MVAPTAFTFNEQAAQDNHFMHAINSGGEVAGFTSIAWLCCSRRHANISNKTTCYLTRSRRILIVTGRVVS